MIDYDDFFPVDERYKAFQDHETGILVSIAGPGTGKTYSLLRRIESLVNDRKINPSSIAYLTFIREISKKFINDYEQEFQCSIKDPDQPRILTLHSFACRLIRNEGFSIGYDGELYFTSIASEKSKESDTFCEDLIPYVSELSLTTKAKIRKKLEIVKHIWQNDGDPGKLEEPIPSLLDITLQLARSYRLVDWDQAVPLAYSLYDSAQEHPKWINELRHFLIDEYQDFNTSEQKFITRIARNVDSMAIVGDDCQSIYRSRGGSPKGILDLYYSGEYNKVTLQRNRRNYSNILYYINSLLLLIRKDASLMLPYQNGGEISCYKFKSSKSEIKFLINYLNKRLSELPAEPKPKDGIVCLFPTKKVMKFYFDELREHIPCYIQGTQNIEEREWLSILMQLYCHPYQRFIERLLLNAITTIKPRHKKTIVRTILNNDISPTDAVRVNLESGNFTGDSINGANEFLVLCERFSSKDIDSCTDYLSNFIDLDPDEIRLLLEGFDGKFEDSDQDYSISDLCDCLLPDTALPPEDIHSVKFVTMHSLKGLTKRVVVMPGLEDSWLPGSSTGSQLAEKTRLFYVALSRAMKYVLITYPINRARGDPLNYPASGRKKVSRFVTEINLNDIYHS